MQSECMRTLRKLGPEERQEDPVDPTSASAHFLKNFLLRCVPCGLEHMTFPTVLDPKNPSHSWRHVSREKPQFLWSTMTTQQKLKAPAACVCFA